MAYKVLAKTVNAGAATLFLGDPFQYWFIDEIPAGATVTVIFDDGSRGDPVPAYKFRQGRTEKPVNQVVVNTDITGVVRIITSLTDRIFDVATAPAGGLATDVNIVSPLNSAGQVEVGGPQAHGHIGPIGDYDNPNNIGVLVDAAGDGSVWRQDPLQGNFGHLYVAGKNRAESGGAIIGPGGQIDVTATKTLRLTCDPGDQVACRFLDQNNQPIPAYTADGRLITVDILESDALVPNGIILLNVAGTTQVTISTAGNWSFRVFHSTDPMGIASPARAARKFVVSSGVLASGTTIIINTAGKKIKVFGYSVSFAAAVDFQFVDSVSGAGLSCKGQQIVNGAENSESPLFELTGNLNFTLSAGVTGSIQIRYEIE